MTPWFLLFFFTPILEMYLLLRVGGWVGAGPTILLVMLTAVTGIALLRRQGLSTLIRGANRLQAGELPAEEVAEGILLAIAGALLITPGFVTDLTGFLLLVPAFRTFVVGKLKSRMDIAAYRQSAATPEPPKSEILEGEFTRRP